MPFESISLVPQKFSLVTAHVPEQCIVRIVQVLFYMPALFRTNDIYLSMPFENISIKKKSTTKNYLAPAPVPSTGFSKFSNMKDFGW